MKEDEALRALLDALIDYAGLFPPATLDVPAAVREYARIRRSPEAWMLGRFIAPASRLEEIAAETAAVADSGDTPWRLSVILPAGSEDHAPDAAAVASVKAIATDRSETITVEAIETRIPPSLLALGNARAIRDHAAAFEKRLAEAGIPNLAIFFEGGECRLAQATVEGLAERRSEGAATGFKLRCGGPRPEDVPPIECVADVIEACFAHHVPLKLTAGLHHAIRSEVGAAGAWHHGFLNVLGAGILAASGRSHRPELLACLLDQSGSDFRLDGAFAWRDRAATAAEVAAVRRTLMVGFGSCSFAEPRDELKALGLLP